MGIAAGILLLRYEGLPLPFINRIVTIPFIEQRPVAVLGAAGQAMAATHTARYDMASMMSGGTGGVPWQLRSQFTFDGNLQPSVVGQFSGRFELQLQDFSLLSALQVHTAAGSAYFRITEVPALPFVDLAAVQNQWYRYQLPVLPGLF
ncbi:MAG: hypothetical protein V1916_00715, partial [Patescibacteria group bacterium]